MKKLVLPLLALIVILGFAFSCASGYTPAPGPDTSSATTESPTVPATSPAPASLTESPSPPTPMQGELKVHFIGVGQGDAIFIDLKDIEVLIDGGDRSPGVVPYLQNYVDGPLEAMIATHPHADHIGGLIDVVAAFEVQQLRQRSCKVACKAGQPGCASVVLHSPLHPTLALPPVPLGIEGG